MSKLETNQKNKAVATCSDQDNHQPKYHVRNDIVPVLDFIKVAIADMKAAPQQVRKSTKKQFEKVRRSIEVFGFVTPILINDKNEIVDGHMRVEAACALGLTSIPCIQVGHLSELEVRALRLALNKTQETGTWDEDILKLEFEYLLEFETDLEITGFEPPEIDNILEIGGPSDDEAGPIDEIDDLPDTNAVAITQPGDLWYLGEHRILCGNARSPDNIAKLVLASPVSMVFTDPPYNVKINGNVRVPGGNFEEFAGASAHSRANSAQDTAKVALP